jgi:DNA polymerase
MLDRTHKDTVLADTLTSAAAHVFFFDVEAVSLVNLEVVGARIYARHPSTKILTVSFSVDGGPRRYWHIGDKLPAEIKRLVAKPKNWRICSHGDFDRLMWLEHLALRYGWPVIPLECWRNTMAIALSLALPASLDLLAKALGLEHTKDTEGAKLMRLMTGRNSSKHDTPENRARLDTYCGADVESLRDAFYAMPELPANELSIYHLNEVINSRGIPIDRQLAEAAHAVAKMAKPALDKELAAITGGAVVTVNQVAKIKAWLATQGCKIDGLDKDEVAAALRTSITADARRVLELRAAGAKNTAAKYGAMLDGLGPDDRLYDLLAYHRASTGRFSSQRVNIHNLARTPLKDPEPAIAAVLSRDLGRIAKLGPPVLVTLANIVRATICAPPGHILLGADFSGIEARIIAWLADERKKLKAFAEFDRTRDPKLDPYLVTAAEMFCVPIGTYRTDAPERAIGKVCTLAFQYGGGLDAWRNFEPDPANPLPDAKVDKFKKQWRQAHPAIVRWWYAINDAAIRAVARPGMAVVVGRITFKQVDQHLYIKLPSGRLLCFPFARLVTTAKGRRQIAAMDNARGQWREVRVWFGTLAENIVSGTARDLLVAAIQRLEPAGFPVIFHVHDELIAEVNADNVELDRFKTLMTELPDWANGLPVAAKAWSDRRYVKS